MAPSNYRPPPPSQALMMDDDLLLDFWLEPIAVGKEVAFRVNSADLESVNGKLKAAGIQVTEAIENVQDAVNFQVRTMNKCQYIRCFCRLILLLSCCISVGLRLVRTHHFQFFIPAKKISDVSFVSENVVCAQTRISQSTF